MDSPFLIDGVNLVGWDVLEVGIRQAWPFLTLGSPLPKRGERRLYIDTAFRVGDSADMVSGAAALSQLGHLCLLTITNVSSLNDGLTITFDNGITLQISGEPSAWTTHDCWWLGGELGE